MGDAVDGVPPPPGARLQPMLARVSEEIPEGPGWVYEPKWDGFRALVTRAGDEIAIASRNGQPLARYFPDVVDVVRKACPERCLLDGEIVIAGAAGLEFDTLSQRIHPAASRVRMLAASTPATLVAFDLLEIDGESLLGAPLSERRHRLEASLRPHPRVVLTPQTRDIEEARSWFTRFEGAGLDGVVAKRPDQPYLPGERAWVKIKHHRSADCVVGGYRPGVNGSGLGSLLLGLYGDDGTLHYVGHTSSFSAVEKRAVLDLLRPLEGGESFGGGRAPGGPSRWVGGKDLSYVSLSPDLVCEVRFEKLEGHRFRHSARFLRWRPDKSPSECTYEQLEPPEPFELASVVELGRRGAQP